MPKKICPIHTENVPGCRALSTDQIHFVCNMFAQFKTVPEIQRLITSVHGIKAPSLPTLYAIRDANIEKIQQLREKYLASVEDIPIAQDKVRLERCELMYHYATTIGKKKDMIDSALKALAAAREETKGASNPTRPGDMNFMQFNFNNMSDKELIALEKKLKRTIIDIETKPAEVVGAPDGKRS